MTSAMTFDDFIGIVCESCPWMQAPRAEWSRDFSSFKASHPILGFCEYGPNGWTFSCNRGAVAYGFPSLREAMEVEEQAVLKMKEWNHG